MLLRFVSLSGAAVRLWRGHGFVCLWWLLIAAAYVNTALAQHHFDSWTAENGLPHNWLKGICQTRDGYLWLETVEGLALFEESSSASSIQGIRRVSKASVFSRCTTTILRV